MSFIKNIIGEFSLNNKDKESIDKYHIALSQLTHDLKNKFITIRAASGSIKKNLSPIVETDVIEKNLSSINKMLDYATRHLEMIKSLSGSPDEFPSDISNFLILNCINEALHNYPFPSQKCLLNITISKSTTDFLVLGCRYLTVQIIYCLIRNAVNAIYSLESAHTTITLEKDLKNNYIHFQIPNALPSKDNLFSLGLPENPGHGFQFIEQAMISMGGNVTLKLGHKDILTCTLIFAHDD
jgi:signal transduction histidine kinase